MKVFIVWAVITTVFLTLLTSCVFLHEYLEAINHWSLGGVKFVCAVLILFTVGSGFVSTLIYPQRRK